MVILQKKTIKKLKLLLSPTENIRNMVTSNYKNILEEMQMTLVIETLSKCIGRVDDIKESCMPRNGNRRQRMNRFLQFILQDDHNVIEFEKVLKNNGLEELLEHKYVPEEHVFAEDIGREYIQYIVL